MLRRVGCWKSNKRACPGATFLDEPGQTSTISCNINKCYVKNLTSFKFEPATPNMSQKGDQTRSACCAPQRYDRLGWNVAIVFSPGLKAEFGHFTLLFCRGRQRNVHMYDLSFLLIKPFVWRPFPLALPSCFLPILPDELEGGSVIDGLISLYLRTQKTESERCEREARGVWGLPFVLPWRPVLSRLYPRFQRLNKNTRK